ncbi:hypothetical protein HPB51_027218 [Rhipicephalus microplus]|uniref:Uncharacterized protein n=1 Tax=Rhipicephalus microplus TaxID=6941 RepID=A0A9J6D0T0_RHIMP|nr:hypothetical protein HPB51_027218 [Rhipicephalus microplus]
MDGSMGRRAHSLTQGEAVLDQGPPPDNATEPLPPTPPHQREPSCSSGNGQPPPGGKPKGSCKVTWSHLASQESRSPERSSLPEYLWKTLNSPIGVRLKKLEKENRVLRDELSRARKQSAKSAKKIDELQKTINEIVKRMAGHARGLPTQRGPMEHTSAAAEEDIDMLDVDGPTVGSKRKNQSGAQADDTDNTQESKRPRSNAKKVDVHEQMI